MKWRHPIPQVGKTGGATGSQWPRASAPAPRVGDDPRLRHLEQRLDVAFPDDWSR
jgi:hypothetical protein